MRQNEYVLIFRISSLENILLVLSLELRVLITCLAALPSLCDGQVSLTIYDYVSQHRLLCLPSVKFCFDFLPLLCFPTYARRRCPHSVVGEDFLAHRPFFFFYKNSRNSDTKCFIMWCGTNFVPHHSG